MRSYTESCTAARLSRHRQDLHGESMVARVRRPFRNRDDLHDIEDREVSKYVRGCAEKRAGVLLLRIYPRLVFPREWKRSRVQRCSRNGREGVVRGTRASERSKYQVFTSYIYTYIKYQVSPLKDFIGAKGKKNHDGLSNRVLRREGYFICVQTASHCLNKNMSLHKV